MILPIYVYGSEVLRQKAAEVDPADKERIRKLVSDMEETLAHAEGCHSECGHVQHHPDCHRKQS